MTTRRCDRFGGTLNVGGGSVPTKSAGTVLGGGVPTRSEPAEPAGVTGDGGPAGAGGISGAAT
jgi:hypothetical protein